METKQTAVEWLTEKLLGQGIIDCPNGIINQALQMEKEQMDDAYMKGGGGCDIPPKFDTYNGKL